MHNKITNATRSQHKSKKNDNKTKRSIKRLKDRGKDRKADETETPRDRETEKLKPAREGKSEERERRR